MTSHIPHYCLPQYPTLLELPFTSVSGGTFLKKFQTEEINNLIIVLRIIKQLNIRETEKRQNSVQIF
jgi:hypothetical protein